MLNSVNHYIILAAKHQIFFACVNRERRSYVTRGGGETRRGSQSAATSAGDRLSVLLPPSAKHPSVLSAPSVTSHPHQRITCHTSIQPSIHKSILSSSPPTVPRWHIHLPLVSQPSDLLSLLNTNKAIDTTLEYSIRHNHFYSAKHMQLLILHSAVLLPPFPHSL